MGLKLRHSCNLLTTLLKNKHDVGALVVASQDTLIDLNNRLLKLVSPTGLDTVQLSMDRLLEQNNRDYLRNTMMSQEEIFKQQVKCYFPKVRMFLVSCFMTKIEVMLLSPYREQEIICTNVIYKRLAHFSSVLFD